VEGTKLMQDGHTRQNAAGAGLSEEIVILIYPIEMICI
jgi:hypothetical protein